MSYWLLGLVVFGTGVVAVLVTLIARDVDERFTPTADLPPRISAPSTDLSPAMATVLLHRRPTRRSVSAALVDLAGRGFVQFEESVGRRGRRCAGIRVAEATKKSEHGVASPEWRLFEDIRSVSRQVGGTIEPDRLFLLDGALDRFKHDLDQAAVSKRWLKHTWYGTREAWLSAAVAETVVGCFFGVMVAYGPSFILGLGAVSWIGAGLLALALLRSMPARTARGTWTLDWLTEQSRDLVRATRYSPSIREIAAEELPWAHRPERVLAWAVAFGLERQVDAVLDDPWPEGQPARPPWRPDWWVVMPTLGPAGRGSRGRRGVRARRREVPAWMDEVFHLVESGPFWTSPIPELGRPDDIVELSGPDAGAPAPAALDAAAPVDSTGTRAARRSQSDRSVAKSGRNRR